MNNPLIVTDGNGAVVAVMESWSKLCLIQPLPVGFQVLSSDKEFQKKAYQQAFEEVCRMPSRWGKWY